MTWSSDPPPEPIHLNLDHFLEIALLGVRRASVFMGLGVNAALDPTLRAYHLTHLTQIQLLPSSIQEHELAEWKSEFRIWIEACGFRELIETFSVYLEAVYRVCLVMHSSKVAKLEHEDFRRMNKRFLPLGFPRKLEVLREEYSVGPQYPDHLVSINQARNCLAHRRGVVRAEDVSGVGTLEVSWTGLDMFVKTPSGAELPLNDIPKEGLLLPDGGEVQARIAVRTRSFKKGDPLMLSTRDIAEICVFIGQQARTTIESVARYGKSLGIRVNEVEIPTRPE